VTARNQTAAVIGSGDFIGAAIAKKLAAEGFTLFVGRRNGDKLAPLVDVQRRLSNYQGLRV
jgi:NAD(P)-dependent dehydrogenase (short-subunit alcohol dehydrogenase family)